MSTDRAGGDKSAPLIPPARHMVVTPASSIRPRPVHWLWSQRIALGTMALLGGREGVGKSTVGYTIAADITRGRLEGRYTGVPKSVLVAATEDSWEHTIVPRLMAAGADLDRVFRTEVVKVDTGVYIGLQLPRDLGTLGEAVTKTDSVLVLLDPLMSRLDSQLDSHKDSEVRIALEPLVRMADETGAAVLGLIHVNKSTSTDPLTTLMASRAFAAVARSVLFVMTDPDDDTEQIRLLGQPKNNLGRTDLPTLTFSIDSAKVLDTDDGEVWTGRLNWIGEREVSIREALESASETSDARSATGEAAEWLRDHLTSLGGTDDSASIKAAGARAGHALSTLKRARTRIKVKAESCGFPRRTFWTLPGSDLQLDQTSGSNPGETGLTGLTEPTGGLTDAVIPVGSVGPVGSDPARDGPTDEQPAGQLVLIKSPSKPRPKMVTRPCKNCGQPMTTADSRRRPTCPGCRARLRGEARS